MTDWRPSVARIRILDDPARYGFGQYERLMSQMPAFSKRGDELRAYIEKMFTHGKIIVIDEEGTLLGLMGIYANDFVGKAAYWSSIVVDSSLHGQGWGLRLLNCARAMCRDAGMETVGETVLKDNTRAVRLYRWFGFEFSECASDPTRYSLRLRLGPPRLSVVCLARNAAPYIKAAIEGFLLQKTNFPIEILIRDDASTDGTAEIIRDYAESNPGMIRTVFREENRSSDVNASMERLWTLIRGEYVAICGGTDRWTDLRKLQKQVDWLDAHPESSVCLAQNESPDVPAQANSAVFRWKLKGREGDIPSDAEECGRFAMLMHAEQGPIGFIP